jgi:hypothetical protein
VAAWPLGVVSRIIIILNIVCLHFVILINN